MYQIVAKVLNGRKLIAYQVIDQNKPGSKLTLDIEQAKIAAVNGQMYNAKYDIKAGRFNGINGYDLRKLPTIQYLDIVSQEAKEAQKKFEQMTPDEQIRYFLENLEASLKLDRFEDIKIRELDYTTDGDIVQDFYFIDLNECIEPGMKLYDCKECLRDRAELGDTSANVGLGLLIECVYKNSLNAANNIKVKIQLQTKNLILPLDSYDKRLQYSLDDAKHYDTDKISWAVCTMVAIARLKNKKKSTR